MSPALKPRKKPSQARSAAAVDAIVEATIRILRQDGWAACTTTRIAALAGVSVGSLYQYFPNRDAILARLAEDEARRESQALQQRYAAARHLPFAESLAQTAACIVESERRMFAFGGEFYRRYAQHFHVAQRAGSRQAGEVLDTDTLIRDTLRAFSRHAAAIGEPDLALAAWLLTRGITSLLGTLVAERPDLLDSRRLESILGRVVAAILDVQPAPVARPRNANTRRRAPRKPAASR